LKIDDDSSPEELSFRGEDDFLDDDINEPLRINLPSDNNGNFCACFGVERARNLKSASTGRIPEYTAAEESKNVRSFQMITLPDGKTREIDMKVSC
jgi:prune family protein 2